MLWNVDNSSSVKPAQEAKNGAIKDKSDAKIKGHALTVKEEFLQADPETGRCPLIEICTRIRELSGSNFLESEVSEAKTPFGSFPICTADHSGKESMLILGSEDAEQSFVKAINDEKIKSWQQFEYVLSFIIENRFFRIYQAYLQN